MKAILDCRLCGLMQIVRRSGDRHHREVPAGGGAAVEAQLLLAAAAPRLEGAEIEEAEAHRLLDLVGEIAREQHPGDVRLDLLDLRDRVGVAPRVGERGDDALRVLHAGLLMPDLASAIALSG
jgi:hypothetical protein